MSAAVSYQDPADQGSTLTEKAVDVHVINGEEQLARWYHSPYDADLMIWFNHAGQPSRFQLNSTGQIVDWNQNDGLRTGLIVEIEVRQEVAETIQFDEKLNFATVEVARVVLANGTGLPKVARDRLVASLSDVRAGTQSKSLESRSRFWGRFKRWTTGT